MINFYRYIRPIILSIVSIVLLAGCNVLPSRNQGALQVTSGENASYAVYLDDTHMGQTPFFDERIKTGNYTLKLTEINSNTSVWQTKVSISKRALTVVNYQPATNQEESSSEILLLEPLADKKETKLSISTLPDHVVIKLNGTVEGFSPMTFDDIGEGDQEIILEGPGYLTKTINAKTTTGHHLIIQAELARDTNLQLEEQVNISEASPSAQATQSAQPNNNQTNINPEETPTNNSRFGTESSDGVSLGHESPEDIPGRAVEILAATVGIDWLRVRETPNGLANNEVARVRVGDYYPYTESSDNGEWREIEYAPDKTGWISAPYGRVVQNTALDEE